MNELVFGKLVDELKLRGRSEGTISAYKTEVLRFAKDFARPLDELSIQDIKAYQLKMIAAGYKNRTVNLRMAALRFFCLHVLEKGWVEKFTPRMCCYTSNPFDTCQSRYIVESPDIPIMKHSD